MKFAEMTRKKKMKFAETPLLIVKDIGMHLNLVTSFPTYAGIDGTIFLFAPVYMMSAEVISWFILKL